VLKEVANTKVFTTLDFCGTHEGNLEIDDTNEDCIMLFDGVGWGSNQSSETQLFRWILECSHF
jgi:hypothetical protein